MSFRIVHQVACLTHNAYNAYQDRRALLSVSIAVTTLDHQTCERVTPLDTYWSACHTILPHLTLSLRTLFSALKYGVRVCECLSPINEGCSMTFEFFGLIWVCVMTALSIIISSDLDALKSRIRIRRRPSISILASQHGNHCQHQICSLMAQ